jgi:hypothetical protein
MNSLKTPVHDPNRIYPRLLPLEKDADMLSPDYLSVASVLLGFASVYMEMKALAWAGLFILLSALLTRNKTDFDKLQTIISACVVISVLLSAYKPFPSQQ